jgi:hypothetical protein
MTLDRPCPDCPTCLVNHLLSGTPAGASTVIKTNARVRGFTKTVTDPIIYSLFQRALLPIPFPP